MKKKIKKDRAVKKPSKLDQLATRTEQDYTDLDTEAIIRQRGLLYYEADTLDAEIASLSLRVSNARRLKAAIEAQIVGIGRVVAKR